MEGFSLPLMSETGETDQQEYPSRQPGLGHTRFPSRTRNAASADPSLEPVLHRDRSSSLNLLKESSTEIDAEWPSEITSVRTRPTVYSDDFERVAPPTARIFSNQPVIQEANSTPKSDESNSAARESPPEFPLRAPVFPAVDGLERVNADAAGPSPCLASKDRILSQSADMMAFNSSSGLDPSREFKLEFLRHAEHPNGSDANVPADGRDSLMEFPLRANEHCGLDGLKGGNDEPAMPAVNLPGIDTTLKIPRRSTRNNNSALGTPRDLRLNRQIFVSELTLQGFSLEAMSETVENELEEDACLQSALRHNRSSSWNASTSDPSLKPVLHRIHSSPLNILTESSTDPDTEWQSEIDTLGTTRPTVCSDSFDKVAPPTARIFNDKPEIHEANSTPKSKESSEAGQELPIEFQLCVPVFPAVDGIESVNSEVKSPARTPPRDGSCGLVSPRELILRWSDAKARTPSETSDGLEKLGRLDASTSEVMVLQQTKHSFRQLDRMPSSSLPVENRRESDVGWSNRRNTSATKPTARTRFFTHEPESQEANLPADGREFPMEFPLRAYDHTQVDGLEGVNDEAAVPSACLPGMDTRSQIPQRSTRNTTSALGAPRDLRLNREMFVSELTLEDVSLEAMRETVENDLEEDACRQPALRYNRASSWNASTSDPSLKPVLHRIRSSSLNILTESSTDPDTEWQSEIETLGTTRPTVCSDSFVKVAPPSARIFSNQLEIHEANSTPKSKESSKAGRESPIEFQLRAPLYPAMDGLESVNADAARPSTSGGSSDRISPQSAGMMAFISFPGLDSSREFKLGFHQDAGRPNEMDAKACRPSESLNDVGDWDRHRHAAVLAAADTEIPFIVPLSNAVVNDRSGDSFHRFSLKSESNQPTQVHRYPDVEWPIGSDAVANRPTERSRSFSDEHEGQEANLAPNWKENNDAGRESPIEFQLCAPAYPAVDGFERINADAANPSAVLTSVDMMWQQPSRKITQNSSFRLGMSRGRKLDVQRDNEGPSTSGVKVCRPPEYAEHVGKWDRQQNNVDKKAPLVPAATHVRPFQWIEAKKESFVSDISVDVSEELNVSSIDDTAANDQCMKVLRVPVTTSATTQSGAVVPGRNVFNRTRGVPDNDLQASLHQVFHNGKTNAIRAPVETAWNPRDAGRDTGSTRPISIGDANGESQEPAPPGHIQAESRTKGVSDKNLQDSLHQDFHNGRTNAIRAPVEIAWNHREAGRDIGAAQPISISDVNGVSQEPATPGNIQAESRAMGVRDNDLQDRLYRIFHSGRTNAIRAPVESALNPRDASRDTGATRSISIGDANGVSQDPATPGNIHAERTPRLPESHVGETQRQISFIPDPAAVTAVLDFVPTAGRARTVELLRQHSPSTVIMMLVSEIAVPPAFSLDAS
jgi:virulence-associated protein VagC